MIATAKENVGLKVHPIANLFPLTAKETVALKIHPVANLFPMIPEVEYEQLKEDVRVHGVREPVWVWQEPGKDFLWLVDGRNRRRCCLGLGIGVPARHWPGDGSLVEFVMSLNFHRRMLKASQRAVIAARAMPMLEEEARKRQEASRARPGQKVGNVPVNLPAPTKGDARDHAAKLANVSGKSVSDAKRVLDQAPSKIAQAVDKGTVSVSDAARIASLPAEKQLEALKKVEAKAAKTLSAALAADDRTKALDKGLKFLRKARAVFAELAATDVVGALDAALKLAQQLQPGGTMQTTAKGKKKIPQWAFDVPGHGRMEAEGHTKGEARAVLKKRLGLDRLPPGTTGAKVKEKKNVA